MKVLFVGSGDDSKGGALSLLELVEMLKKNFDYDIIVINPKKNKLNKKCDDLEIENYHLGFQEMICQKRGGLIKFWLKYVLKYIRYVVCNHLALKRAMKYDFSDVDLIHSNTTAIDFGAKLANKLKKPHVWHIREFGREDFNFYYFHRDVAGFINENSEKVITVSDAVYRSWSSKGVDESKMIRIYHGVAGSKYKNVQKKAEESSNKKLRLILCGGVTAAKGQSLVIDALEKIKSEKRKEIQVDFYGHGKVEYIEKLKRKAKTSGVYELISFEGYFSNIEEFLPLYNVGLICSRAEAFGRVTVEYLLSGLCVLASDSGASSELLQGGKYGIMFKANNANSLAEQLEQLVDYPDKVEGFAQKAAVYALENFLLDNNIHKIINVYNELDEQTR